MMGSDYFPLKIMKRKDLDLDEVSDDLNDFSLSSPARKIRRLNAQLPPIMEEEKEHELVSETEILFPSSDMKESSQLQTPVNEERAIVLYKPVNSPVLLQSPSNVSVNLDSIDLIPGFKNEFLRASQRNRVRLVEEEEDMLDKNAASNQSLAVIPYVPSDSQFPYLQRVDVPQTEAPELMEAENEQVEMTDMDVEDSSSINSNMEQGQVYDYGGMRDEGVHQWSQQHCMMPTFAQNTSTPISWYR